MTPQSSFPVFETKDGKLTCVNEWWYCSCGLWNKPKHQKCAKCSQLRGETTCPKCGEKFHPKVSD